MFLVATAGQLDRLTAEPGPRVLAAGGTRSGYLTANLPVEPGVAGAGRRVTHAAPTDHLGEYVIKPGRGQGTGERVGRRRGPARRTSRSTRARKVAGGGPQQLAGPARGRTARAGSRWTAAENWRQARTAASRAEGRAWHARQASAWATSSHTRGSSSAARRIDSHSAADGQLTRVEGEERMRARQWGQQGRAGRGRGSVGQAVFHDSPYKSCSRRRVPRLRQGRPRSRRCRGRPPPAARVAPRSPLARTPHQVRGSTSPRTNSTAPPEDHPPLRVVLRRFAAIVRGPANN